MSVSFSDPSLNYVGSVDISSSHYGTNQFTILLDPSMSTLGNILMFEYKIQTTTEPTIPDNVVLGYISVDSGACIQTGISNQWQIGIPAEANINTENRSVVVRAYTGLISTSEVVASGWSNSLIIYNPPAEPHIHLTFYDAPSSNQDDLYVYLKSGLGPLENNYNWTDPSLSFIMAYYFENHASPSETVWSVSEPLTATPVPGSDLYQLVKRDFGIVSTTYPAVYVSVYAVYSWTDGEDEYHSVSHVSGTQTAVPSTYYNNPTITGVDYAVYNFPSLPYPGDQNMTVNWLPPTASVLPIYTVQSYELEYTLNDPSGSWIVVASGLSSSTLSYVVNPWTLGGARCEDTVYFRVRAIYDQGLISNWSNYASKNIFTFSTSPTDLLVSNISYNTGSQTVSFTVSFNQPTNKGCGTGLQYVVLINGEIYTPTSGSLVYGSSSYSIEYTDLDIANSGDVVVYLQTRDTNTSNIMNGQSSSVNYIAEVVTLNPVDYSVYDDKVNQTMTLTWDNPYASSTQWSVQSFNVYYAIDNGTPTQYETPITNGETSKNFTPPFTTCGLNYTFYILTIVTDGTTTYEVQSNSVSINIFKFADPPTMPVVVWASSDPQNTYMDIYGYFTKPVTMGCGTNPSFSVTVRNANGNALSYYGTTIAASTSINYFESQNLYEFRFDNVTFSATGYVELFTQTTDTNSSNIELSFSGNATYTASSYPIVQNLTVNEANNQISFDVVTQSNLSRECTALIFDSATSISSMENLKWLTTSTEGVFIDGRKVEYVVDPTTFVITYHVVIDAVYFNRNNFGVNVVIIAFNPTGPGSKRTIVY